MPHAVIEDACALIGAVPGFEGVAADLRRRSILFVPGLADRGQTSLLGSIRVGPEAFEGTPDLTRVSLAGTLVHEHWHTRQNPLLKTVSFWGGVLTRHHPMRRYEQPAYARQQEFLQALAASHPSLAMLARRERLAVEASFDASYGGP